MLVARLAHIVACQDMLSYALLVASRQAPRAAQPYIVGQALGWRAAAWPAFRKAGALPKLG